MIPEFDDNSNLPPGIHEATIDEIIKRFSLPRSSKRRSLTKSLRAFISFIRPYAKGIYIDGSYTTKKLAPGDVDIVVFLRDGVIFSLNADQRFRKYFDKKSHLHIFLGVPEIKSSMNQAQGVVVEFQQNDRDFNPPVKKGIIRVRLDND